MFYSCTEVYSGVITRPFSQHLVVSPGSHDVVDRSINACWLSQSEAWTNQTKSKYKGFYPSAKFWLEGYCGYLHLSIPSILSTHLILLYIQILSRTVLRNCT